MTDESPFSPAAALASLRELPATDPELRVRVQQRLAASLVGPAPTLPAPPVSPAAHGISAGWLVPVFAAGALVGLVADHWFLRPSPAVELPAPVRTAATVVLSRASDAASINVASATPVVVASAGAVPPAGAAASVAPVASGNGGATAGTESAPRPFSAAPVVVPANSLTAERLLLDAARSALARGEPRSGIASLEKHVRQFPKGTLLEEREALYVRILAAAGAAPAATARAEAFQRRFPKSIFFPVVERALRSVTPSDRPGTAPSTQK